IGAAKHIFRQVSHPSIPTQKLNLAQQLFSLRQFYPEGKGAIKHLVLTWEGQLRPTPLSRTYNTTVTYRVGSAPKTRGEGNGMMGRGFQRAKDRDRVYTNHRRTCF